ncbi:MAG: zinc ribbon domain-containing protein [Spirochaetales bacterium]|nr:zinc ribbon domain-containing protein [Spirochaetales bacterium]MDY5915842.1 zinc ribbon domain-containing protein [Treponema sp.]
MAFCQNCGKELADGAKFCDGCGTPIGGAADETKRTQKFLAGGVQYKCPNCGEILPRTAIKCTSCGYKVDFKENVSSAKQLLKLIEEKGKTEVDDDEYEYSGELVAGVVKGFDFPLDSQEMLELAIFAGEKTCHPFAGNVGEDEDNNKESLAWIELLKRLYSKAAILTENKDVEEKIEKIKNDAEENYKKLVSKKKKGLVFLIAGSLILCIVYFLLIGIGIKSCTQPKKLETMEKTVPASEIQLNKDLAACIRVASDATFTIEPKNNYVVTVKMDVQGKGNESYSEKMDKKVDNFIKEKGLKKADVTLGSCNKNLIFGDYSSDFSISVNNDQCIIKSEAAQNVLMNIKDNETKTITFQISKYNDNNKKRRALFAEDFLNNSNYLLSLFLDTSFDDPNDKSVFGTTYHVEMGN